ncbi:MAG: porin family protein [Flavobacteriales bacterium]|nr:porin family protein [Flavobacteriales bacterium]
MKKGILLFIAIFTFASLHAQKDNKIGIKAGFNYNAANYDLAHEAWDNLKDVSSNNGWHLGINYRGYLGDIFYWQPELMYSQTAFTIINAGKESKFHESMIDLNLIVGVELLDFLRFYAGPTGSFNLGTSQSSNDIETSFNSFRAGYQIGAGVDILSMITFDLGYKGSFSSDNGNVSIAGVEVPLTQNVSQMIISVGFMF